MSTNDITHFGVKGMKWGVRRQAKRQASSDDARNAQDSKVKVKKAKGTHVLSNKELQDLVTRMNLEQQFDKLKPASKSRVVGKFVADLMLSVGKQQAQKIATDAATKQIAKLLAGRA